MKKVVTFAFVALLVAGCGAKNYKSMTVAEFAKQTNVSMAPADSSALVAGIAKYAMEHPDTAGLSVKKIGDLMDEGKKMDQDKK